MENSYLTFGSFIMKKYKKKMRKIALYTSTTCPNRDGSLSEEGCHYCNNVSFNPYLKANKEELTINEQLNEGIERIKKKYPDRGIIAYYQSYSNTYGEVDFLKELYAPALRKKEIDIVSIATRPDCLSEEVLELLRLINKQKEIWLEIGLQSSSDEILREINRGHDVKCFKESCRKARDYIPNVRITTHLIFGLPGEKERDVINSAEICKELKIDGVKIHPLTIVKDTIFADKFKEGLIQLITEDEFVKRAALFIKKSRSDLVIERISEDSDDLLIAPQWAGNKRRLRELIHARLARI